MNPLKYAIAGLCLVAICLTIAALEVIWNIRYSDRPTSGCAFATALLLAAIAAIPTVALGAAWLLKAAGLVTWLATP